MKISHIGVENYRSLQRLEIEIDDYTAIIGPNGAGKSSILYALEWFFNDSALHESDVYRANDDDTNAVDRSVSVTVTFTNLTAADRDRLGGYGRGETARFTRTWSPGGSSKLFGNAKSGPGFFEVRNTAGIVKMRNSYIALREAHPELPVLSRLAKPEEIEANLSAWEADPAHQHQLEDLNALDTNHMKGFAGTAALRECARIVLVPASIDFRSQIGESRKGNALSELVGRLVSTAGVAARNAWSEKYQDALKELEDTIRTSVEDSTRVHTTRVNTTLQALVPNACAAIEPTIPDVVPSQVPTVSMNVSIDGLSNDIARQGHGVQRAVMVSVLQSLVPDRVQLSGQHRTIDGESEAEARERLDREIAALPTLIVCIEEPEVYQHPIRARSFARTLTENAAGDNTQVIVATHSPYFVRPEQFTSLRRISIDNGASTVISRTAVDIATRATLDDISKVIKFLERSIPASFSEGFFADAVVLVEGDTDKVVIESLSDKLGYQLDALGVSVLDMNGKENLRIPTALFVELGVPVYVVADGDALGHTRILEGTKGRDLAKTQADSLSGHTDKTNKLLAWLKEVRSDPSVDGFSFGDSTMSSSHVTIWEDDIEGELSSWPSFMTALNANDGQLRVKNPAAYKAACVDADVADLPDSLRACVEMIEALAKSPTILKA